MAACREFRLQVLTKFRHDGFTQKIAIAFPAFCQLNDPLRSFVGKIALLAKVKGFASHFKCEANDSLGLAVESAIVQKLRHGHDERRLNSELTMQMLRVRWVTNHNEHAMVQSAIAGQGA
jgi:hypothetical protein